MAEARKLNCAITYTEIVLIDYSCSGKLLNFIDRFRFSSTLVTFRFSSVLVTTYCTQYHIPYNKYKEASMFQNKPCIKKEVNIEV